MFLAVPFTYDISIAVRKQDTALRAELDRALDRERMAIKTLLAEFAIPLAGADQGDQACVSLPQRPFAFSH